MAKLQSSESDRTGSKTSTESPARRKWVVVSLYALKAGFFVQAVISVVRHLDPDFSVGLLALMVSAGPLVAVYLLGRLALRRWRDRTAAAWPTAPGELCYGGVGGTEGDYTAKLGYIYRLDYKCYFGYYHSIGRFLKRNSALGVVRVAEGQPVTVRYKPNNRSVSRLLRSDNEQVKLIVDGHPRGL